MPTSFSTREDAITAARNIAQVFQLDSIAWQGLDRKWYANNADAPNARKAVRGYSLVAVYRFPPVQGPPTPSR